MDSNSFGGSEKSQWKTFWKEFTILDTIQNIHDSWVEVKIPTWTEIWKKLTPTLIDDLKGFKTSVEEITADVVETARKLEGEPEDGIALLPSYDQTWKDEELLLMGEWRMWFLEMEFTPGGDAMKIVGMMTKDLEYYINFVNQAATGFERLDSNSERSSTMGKVLPNRITYYREIICEKKSPLMWQISFLSCFKKWPQPPPPLATTTWTVRSQQHQKNTLHQQKD